MSKRLLDSLGTMCGAAAAAVAHQQPSPGSAAGARRVPAHRLPKPATAAAAVQPFLDVVGCAVTSHQNRKRMDFVFAVRG